MLEALKSLSVFFTENSLRTRRNLRGDIERCSLSINEEFVRIFKEVKEVNSQWQFYTAAQNAYLKLIMYIYIYIYVYVCVCIIQIIL